MIAVTIETVAAVGGISPAAAEVAFAPVIFDYQGHKLVSLAHLSDVCRRTEADLAAELGLEVIEL